MPTTTVSDKGQVVIPAELRRRFGIEPGTRLEFIEEGAELRLRIEGRLPRTSVEEGYGMHRYQGPPHRLADFDVAEAMREAG